MAAFFRKVALCKPNFSKYITYYSTLNVMPRKIALGERAFSANRVLHLPDNGAKVPVSLLSGFLGDVLLTLCWLCRFL